MKLKKADAFWDRSNLNNVNYNFESIEKRLSSLQNATLDLLNDGKLTDAQFQDLQIALNELVKKGDVSVNDINKSLGKIDQTYLTEELIQQIAGNANVNAIPADDSITTNKIVRGAVTPEKTSFFTENTTSNLLNIDTLEKGKTVDADGTIISDDLRWLTDFIPLDSTLEEQINFTQSFYRIALYDKDKEFISRTGSNGTYYKPNPSTFTKYVRISGTKAPEEIMMNKGTSLLPYEKPIDLSNIKLKPEFIDLPDLGDISFDNIEEHQLSDKLKSKIEQQTQVYTPSIPKLKFDEVSVGYDEALWLSQDGKRIYGKTGSKLWVSFDECTTLTTVIPDTFKSVQAVRELDDGELLFSTERDVSGGTQNGRVYKTRGFNKETGTVESYDLKIETDSKEAKVNNSWGMSVYDNFITLSEYGLKTEEGARRVWFSQDFGETFKIVFDQMTDVESIKGAPVWVGETAHMHTAAFDPYWNRLWVVTGDYPNSAMYYSDDFGETWIWVDVGNKPIVQYTGIIALPNCVLFGSDRAPNGVYVYYRGQKSDMPKVEPLLLINDRDKISHIFQLPFKRDWQSETPVYFGATNAGDIPAKSTCIATVDGKKAFIVHENEQNEMFGGKCGVFLGPTEQGNIIGTFQDDDISGFRIGKAKTLDWIKM